MGHDRSETGAGAPPKPGRDENRRRHYYLPRFALR